MKHVLCYALGLSWLAAQGLAAPQGTTPQGAAEKIVVNEDVRKILAENYHDFRENVRKVAEKETREQMNAGRASLLQKSESVRLPICDLERSPMNWKFITPNEDEHVLKYIGVPGGG